MKTTSRLIIKALLICLLIPCVSVVNAQKLLDNHIEVMEQFSRIKSKSQSLVSISKRNLAGKPALDSIELMYIELKESSDGAISRYKSIIDNPGLAKKTEATLTENLNEIQNDLAQFQMFVSAHLSSKNLGFQQANPLALITTFTGFGSGLIKDLNSMQKSKRDEAKKAIDENKLGNWVDIQ